MEQSRGGAGTLGNRDRETSIRRLLFETSHRRIGWLYLFSITAFFLLGSLFGMLLRIEGTSAQESVFSAQTYARLFSMHGLFMIFLFLLPAIPSVLGNFLLPAMVGSRELAFPRLNLLGWVLHCLGGICLLLVVFRGGVESTWTLAYASGSTEMGGSLLPAIVGLGLVAGSVLLQAINFVATIHRLRSPGRPWMQLPIFAWSVYFASWVNILASPILLSLLFLLGAVQILGSNIFDPGVTGEPILFQQMFWFYARPTLYAVILPALGVISEIVSSATGGKVIGYRIIVGSMLAIAVLSVLTAGSHLLSSLQSPVAILFVSLVGYLTAVPFAAIFGNWLAALYRGIRELDSALLFALGGVLVVMAGGMTGLFLVAAGGYIHLHSTVFVVAHFHFLLAGGVTMAYLAGLHHWWPALSGHKPNEGLARPAAVIVFAGLNLTFVPLFILGFLGLPRRLFSYPAEFEALNVLSFAGATILLVGYLLPMVYLAGSLRWRDEHRENGSIVVPLS